MIVDRHRPLVGPPTPFFAGRAGDAALRQERPESMAEAVLGDRRVGHVFVLAAGHLPLPRLVFVRPDVGGDDGGLKAVIQRRSVKLLPGVRMREDEIVGAIFARLLEMLVERIVDFLCQRQRPSS